ncbi:hypothetical protein Bca4012_026928 [Brassica carinata]
MVSFVANFPSFISSMQDLWDGLLSRPRVLSSLSFSLKGLKRPIKTLAKENLSDIERRVAEAKDSLDSIQLSALTNPSENIFELEKSAKDQWIFLRLPEECFFRQRSRIKWLQLGDLNTAFFHRSTLVRNALNAIKYLLRADGTRSESLEEVHKIALDYFSEILCNEKGSFCPYLPDILRRIVRDVCSDFQRSLLAAPISRELIKATMFKLSLNRTPGPDGWTAEFFRATWLILGEEVTDAVLDFFANPFMPSALNATTLILIPKRPGAENIADFSLISCLNTIYKLVTKVISVRLKKVLPSIILPNQTGFVENRLILENVLLASEVLNGYHKKGLSPRITLKVDISKAFDSVRWDFIIEALRAFHFPDLYIDWVRACICSPSFSISINGVTSGYFKGKTGLRQGDPLSPPLFVVVMNVLSIMLNRGAAMVFLITTRLC